MTKKNKEPLAEMVQENQNMGLYDSEQDNIVRVLDKGFVRLVDHMGDDSAIVQMARVSYGEGTKKVSEDKALVRYLLRNRHTSPFEGVVFKFHIRAPLFVIRQWHRHRTWAYNEMSGRYSVMPDDCYVPKEEHVTTQDPNNKQGGTDIAVPFEITKKEYEPGPENWPDIFSFEQEQNRKQYEEYIDSGMRRELARINLPLSQYSEMYAVVNLHNLLHFLKLRMDPHAQFEIREYAEALFQCIKDIVPVTCEAFEEYILNTVTLNQKDMEILSELLLDASQEELAAEAEILMDNHGLKNKRERKEFLIKLEKIQEA